MSVVNTKLMKTEIIHRERSQTVNPRQKYIDSLVKALQDVKEKGAPQG